MRQVGHGSVVCQGSAAILTTGKVAPGPTWIVFEPEIRVVPMALVARAVRTCCPPQASVHQTVRSGSELATGWSPEKNSTLQGPPESLVIEARKGMVSPGLNCWPSRGSSKVSCGGGSPGTTEKMPRLVREPQFTS